VSALPGGIGRLWPRSLFARLMLILFIGIIAAQAMSFSLVMYDRQMAMRNVMLNTFEQDIATSIAILDRLPAAERASWLTLLERSNYRYRLDAGSAVRGADTGVTQQVTASLVKALGNGRNVSVKTSATNPQSVEAHLKLEDGSPLTIDLKPAGLSFSPRLPVLLLLQLVSLAVCAFFAVRLAIRPLRQLASAADALGPDLKGRTLPENGPTEVARASTAFNAMQKRIAGYVTERTQILAAISHDLQTPITRMRLRADLMDDDEQRQKLERDLDEMVVLVREALTYARSLHGTHENPSRLDLDGLLDTLKCDYGDAGHHINVIGSIGRPVVSQHQVIRRILTNLIDNALKFGNQVELHVGLTANERVEIGVLDRGPGIPESQLEAVMQPFYRLENSRSRSTGGSGLGLAIAQQLASALGATLTLSNREGGGLAATLLLPLK
jgi:signal transduction histidine kinase